MVTAAEIRGRLLGTFRELFQLDQPDLDFGFYKIMHAKAEEVGKFISEDLLKNVEDVFGKVDETRKSELKAKYEELLAQAKGLGAPDPEEAPMVKAAKAAYDDYKSGVTAEADVYDHLLRFFSRYYETGDFISRRYYARETAGKAAPFAVPYNGEEVKLHWANADQYYIKSTDYFSNYTFDLRKVNENRELLKDEKLKPLRVHFRIIDATEGEHGNIKAASDNKRFFLLHEANPVELDENGELVVNFEYRPAPEKSGQDKTWQERRNEEAVESVLNRLETMNSSTAAYRLILSSLAPTEKKPQRTVLAKYLEQFTARNTMDFFIHKDLGGFLHRELDFYIKNEVMRLDDIEDADAPTVESYLEKIKVIRRIAGKLIDFLAQLENFQKKLWLKKKFVLETNYCITLDRVPEKFYPEIAANQAQHDEWIELFAIHEIEKTLTSPGYAKKLSVEFLKANGKLVLDTKHFDGNFKARLIESIDHFDEQCDGLLIHSENFQALNLLQERFREQIKCVYIDPPYNTNASEIVYKNGYKSSSWLSLMFDRVLASRSFMTRDANLCMTIDDVELNELSLLLDSIFSVNNHVATVPIRINPSGRPSETGFALTHEYALFYRNTNTAVICRIPRTDKQMARFKERDEQGLFEYRNLRREGSNSDRADGQRQFYPFYADTDTGKIRVPQMQWEESKREWTVLEQPHLNETVIYPIDDEGREKNWRWSEENVKENYSQFRVRVPKNGTPQIDYKYRSRTEGTTPLTLWTDTKYSATEYGTGVLKNIFVEPIFSYPKSIYAVEDCVRVTGASDATSCTILDYFSGSGTTGHAVINLNREDEGNRKCILVEMGDYFNTVLKPRIAKVVYAKEWRDGKPVSRDTGVSHCFKYIRLESYEDTLNNLRFNDAPGKSKLMKKSPSLREDYMLRYMLDVETRGSQSLLNIDAFNEPEKYLLNVKKANSDEYIEQTVDLLETFNYLIGLRVEQIQATQRFNAEFKRIDDPDLPEDQQKKLAIDGPLKQDANGTWSFRAVYGWVPKNPGSPNDGLCEKVLIVWRNLTGDLEKDNAVLDEWFRKNRTNPRDLEFDTIYVNGSNNLPNIKRDEENWKVQLIEEEFARRMWDVETI